MTPEEQAALDARYDTLEKTSDLLKDIADNTEYFNQATKAAQEGIVAQMQQRMEMGTELVGQGDAILEKLTKNNELQEQAAQLTQDELGKKFEVLSAAEKENTINQRKLKLINDTVAGIRDSVKLNQDNVKWAKQLLKDGIDTNKHQNILNKLFKDAVITQKQGGGQTKEQLETYIEQQKTARQLVARLEEVVEATDEATDGANEMGQKLKEADNAASFLAQSFFGISGNATTIVGAIGKMREKGMNFKQVLEKMGELITDPWLAADALISKTLGQFGKFEQAFLGLNQSLVDINRAAGLMFDRAELQSALNTTEALGGTVDEFGVSLGEQGAAFQGLLDSSTAFASITGENMLEVRMQVASLGSVMQKAGIQTQNYGKLIDHLSKNLGKTPEDFESATVEVVAFSNALGISADKYVSEMTSAMKTLSVYGAEAEQEFRKLQTTAVGVGISMDSMLAVAGKFDTFESAANMVGDLNAMLRGPYFNTIDLINAKESERIDILRQGLKDSQQSFAEMDRFAQKAIAETLGTDVETAMRLFDGTAKSIEEVEEAMRQEAMTAEGLSEKLRGNISVQEKMNLVMDRLFRSLDEETIAKIEEVFMTLAKTLGDIAEWLAKNADSVMPLVTAFMKFGPILMIMSNLAGVIGGVGKAALQAGGMGAAGAMKWARGLQGVGIALGGIMAARSMKDEEGNVTAGGKMLAMGSGAMGGAMTGAGFGVPGMLIGGALGALGGLAGTSLFADGTTNAPRGLGIVGEAGAELMQGPNGASLIDRPTMFNMKGGESVRNNAATQAVMKGGASRSAGAIERFSSATRESVTLQQQSNHVISNSVSENSKSMERIAETLQKEGERPIEVAPTIQAGFEIDGVQFATAVKKVMRETDSIRRLVGNG